MNDTEFFQSLEESPIKTFLEDYRLSVINDTPADQPIRRQEWVSEEPARDIDQLPYVIKEVIEYEEKKAGIGIPVLFTQEHPDSDIFEDIFKPEKQVNELGEQYGDIIQFKLFSRLPGSYQQTAKPMAPGNTREYTRHLRFRAADPDFPGYELSAWGQWYDNLFQLVCWAKTAKQANARAMWVEDVMERYAHIFKLKGFSHIRYEGRDQERTFVPDSRAFKLAGRYLTFYCKTEKILLVREKSLEEVFIKVGLTPPNQ